MKPSNNFTEIALQIGWEGYVACMRVIRSVYRILVIKPKAKDI